VAPPRGGGPRLIDVRPDPLRRALPALLLLIATAIAGACGPAPARGVAFDWAIAPAPPVVGGATLTLRLSDAAGHPVEGARLRIEGHMSHPGMAPVIAKADERGPGVYEAPVSFTMRGDWILLVTGTLASGERIEHRIDVRNVQPPSG
jgi:hypothetical protein